MDQGLAELTNGLLRMKEGEPRYRTTGSSRTSGPTQLPFQLNWLNSKAAVMRFPGEPQG
jgi:hypothetical protein